ncbi:MAG: DEAD/DEAH box helicase family protein [Fischerella sp.]|nr:DEAD/DEAH box helicase family protein [Fischerella sp.]
MITLHPHQLEAINSIINCITTGAGSAKGRVVMPTGAGKTFVEASVLDYQRKNNQVTAIHVVLAPRILLANQLIEEFRKYSGLTYRAIAFHSGNLETDYEKGIRWKEHATTRVADIKKAYINATESGQDLVVFSTYHSCNKLKGIKFDTLIADESQYCVNEGFGHAVSELTARVKLFFTATEKHTASNRGRGLNNSSIYGDRIYYISPAELIKRGLIVPPRLHVLYAETAEEKKSIVHEVIELAREQDKITRPELGFSKILFAMKGTADVKTVEDNIQKVQTEFPDHEIFTITSRNGARINNVRIPREQFLDRLKQAKNALIFHYDILSEGIDVDGITGVALLRNLGLSKLLQTIGRAVRIYKPNPSAKKWALISVSVINGDEDDKENVKYYIQAIRNGGYDISAEDVVETGKPRHTPEDDDIGDAYSKAKNNFANLFLVDIFHEVEEEEIFNNLRVLEKDEDKIDALLNF